MFSKLLRIGRDAELRTTANGTSVCSIAGVYDVGFGDKKRSQWIDAVLWGKQSEALAPYLLKGNQVVIYADDLELETYTKGDGTSGAKLKCRVVSIDLTDKKQSQETPARQQPQQQQAPTQQAPSQAPQQQAPNQQPQTYQQGPANSFDDSEDIPF